MIALATLEKQETTTLGEFTSLIVGRRREVPRSRALLVAVTGIDGCGKGHVAARLVAALRAEALRAVAIGIDGWLNLPHVRFGKDDPAAHFYRHAIRFEPMFRQLILPLRDRRSRMLVADYAEETATAFRQHLYLYENVEVIVLEGIYLLKRELRDRYDLSLWIDCSFETALARAVARAQEGLPPEETVRAYRTIYFPAQEMHLQRDDPRAAASAILNNDPRLASDWHR